MALLTRVGSFTTETSVGSKAYSGIGFQPKAVIFWLSGQTATGFATNRRLSFGWGASSSQRGCCATITNTGTTGTGNTGSRMTDTKVLLGLTIASGVVGTPLQADLVSLDPDGFTLTYSSTTTLPNPGYLVNYLALGGDDITNVYAGNDLSRTTAGNQSYTGVGFQPDFLLTVGLARPAPVTGSFAQARVAIGAATSASQRASTCTNSDDAIPTSVGGVQVATKIHEHMSTTPSTFLSADLVTMDSDGFTLNWTTANATARVFFYLALKGGKYAVSTDTQKTSTGTQAKTGLGMQPSALMLIGRNVVSSTANDVDTNRFSIGASDGTNERAIWGDSTDNVSTTVENMYTGNDKILRHATNTSTVTAEANLTSFDSDGYTLNWTTADATAREFLAFAFGSTPGIAVPGWIRRSRRTSW